MRLARKEYKEIKTKRYLTTILSILLLSFCVGCASFRTGHFPSVSFWPPESIASKKSISVIVSGKATVNGEETDVLLSMLTAWQEQTVKAYRDSGLFSDVKQGLTETDLRAEVQIVDQANFNSTRVLLTVFTLYIIPGNFTDEFLVKTTMRDREGTVLGTFESSGTVTTWAQLFLIIAMPFNHPNSVARGTIYDLNRVIINEAHAKGYLQVQ